ncbi:MAG: ATP-grasp domain-containing protein [Chloroflexota bacterium]|nr:ATP-grasp domain-containing protein [Chloroflexota bacterium]MDE3193705.1 ATP-grasp domain-containing protein [Chloroflexota bacterium]
MVTSVLVANRGEIARRIFRTARRMGLGTVAVYSDADADAPHVREADRAIRIGPAPAKDSYLSIDRIVAAALEGGAELVHPGYGFLAEEPELARAVAAARLTFVGPPAEVLALCGSKAQAKAVARRAGVPVLAGYAEDDQRDAAFAEAARLIGYPVMVKPTAGGGGIGMQEVTSREQLPEALARARRLARAAFGDERLMIERYVPSPRHVEVQILADEHERIRTIGERDCSAQRRHQKIVEEAPAPHVTRWQRDKLAEWATAMAHAARYVGAGTVEFVVDAKGDIAFLEVNARLQVEHPVTEAVTGFDLVEQQLRIALGERLELPKAEVHGHAIEARVYAEDPASGFLPSTGRLQHVRWPEGVRVDAGYEEGSTVSSSYDPLLAKIVAHGSDRGAALDALADALARTEILGVRTNVSFLQRYLSHSEVRAGRVTTSFIERELPALVARGEVPDEVRALAACAVIDERPRAPRDPWSALGAWRPGVGYEATVVLREGERETAVTVEGDGPYVVGGSSVARDAEEPHRWTIGDTGSAVAREDDSVWVSWSGATHELRTDPAPRRIEDTVTSEIGAPMPGVVLSIHAAAGQRVQRGDLVAVLEAMKMELRVEAPADGVVTAVLARPGEQVKRGQRLADFEPKAQGTVA